jgi:hypothetical protein
MPTRLTRLDCYNRHRLFEHKGAARRLFVSSDADTAPSGHYECRTRKCIFSRGRIPPSWTSRQSSSVRAAFVRRLHLSQHSSDQRRNPMVARAPEADGRVP